MRTILKILGTATLLALGGTAHGADTDLFLGPASTTTVGKSNILFVIDNAGANNGDMTNPCGGTDKKLETQVCILKQVLQNDPNVAKLNIGLETFNPSGATKGGYIRSHVRDMAVDANLTSLLNAVNTLNTTNNAPFAKSMHEAYLYYSAKTPYAGISSNQYDSAAYDSGTGKYNSPALDRCQRNYIIFIGNGGPDSSENTDAQTLLNNLGGVNTGDPIKLTPDNYQTNWSDEYARFMYGTDVSSLDGQQNIVTYSIAINTGSGPENTTPAKAGRKLIESMAVQGKGIYYEVANATELAEALSSILVKIQAVNSVFASVTLPVSVNVRGTYLNQVYMGVFRPDADALPRWLGNLKQYQLDIDGTGTLQLTDMNNKAATNNATGFINSDVQSFWTENSTFWSFSPKGVGGASDNPDGDLVEKGGAAQMLRTTYADAQTARKLYTCTGTCANGSLLSVTPFNTANTAITTANTGAADATELTSLINWARGQDNKTNENGNVDASGNQILTDARASIHGDVLHSRPAVVNYNRYADSHDVFVFYGSNDGIFRALQGGQLTSGARKGGSELWGFIPSEFFGDFKRLRDNDVNIITTERPYFVDGGVGVYQLDSNNDGKLEQSAGDKVHLFLSMRRGGQFIYALDASAPETPKFLWKRSSSDTNYGELGETWSIPKPVKIRASTNPVLIMGAGYDPVAEDVMPQGVATRGRGVMVIDATDGTMIWQAGPSGAADLTVSDMKYSMAADMMVFDRDGDGLNDRIYAADTGGNIWRLDIDSADPNDWTVTKLAALGGGGVNPRKFLYAPDVVLASPSDGQSYDALLIGSGDREHPFDETVVNRFYMIKDFNTGKVVAADFTTITEPDLYDTTSNVIQEGSNAQIDAAKAALDAAKGWYITLGTGEKIVGRAVTLSGSVFFGTNQPSSASSSACNNLGTARVYVLNFKDGSAMTNMCTSNGAALGSCDRSQVIPGGGFLPSPTPVTINIDGQIGQGPCFGPHCFKPEGSNPGARRRVFWHHNVDK